MKILLSSLPHMGHIVPMNVLKTELESRGHEVSWDIPDYPTGFSGPLTEHLSAFQELSNNYKAILLSRIAKSHFDLLVVDPTIFCVEEIGQITGIAWAIFSNLPIFYDFRRVPLLIQGSIPEFEGIRASNLLYSGPTLPFNCLPFEEPARFGEIMGSIKPIIYVTQGTVANQEKNLLSATKIACGNDYLCIDWYMQYHYFMQFADIFITNGGYGGVQAALYAGVPMIIAGETEDKPIVAKKAVAAGIAVDLETANPSPETLSLFIELILQNKAMKARCQELSKIAKSYLIQPTIRALENLVFEGKSLGSSQRSIDYPAKPENNARSCPIRVEEAPQETLGLVE